MICDRVQAELSGVMDGEPALSSEAARHLSTCDDCADFQETATEVTRRYAQQVRAGIDRLRRLEPPVRKGRSFSRWLVPLAAAAFLCWLGIPGEKPVPAVALVKAAPTPPPRVRFFEEYRPSVEEEEESFVFDRELVLPVRLDQEFLPARSSDAEIVLPLSLRF